MIDPPSPSQRIRATVDDLPAPLRETFRDPAEGRRIDVDAAGIRWSAVTWGADEDRPLLLLHGVTASAAIWWRVGAVLAATGRHVVAPDLPGHGRTGQWRGHARFEDNARDVGAFVTVLGFERPGLQVVGHSWGAMTAAALPGVGLIPDTLVLLDPPVLPEATIARLADDPSNRRYASLEEARAVVRTGNPDWSPRDVDAKAEALVQLQLEAAHAVLRENGDWDGGLAALEHPGAANVAVWLIRGEARSGGYVAADAVPGFETRLGADRVLTIVDGPHAPQRTHPTAVLIALLQALGD